MNPHYSDHAYAIAECDENGDLPHPLSAVRWIATPYDPTTNTPDPTTLHTYWPAYETAGRLLASLIAAWRTWPDETDEPTPLAIVHITPDGCRPLVWIAHSDRCGLLARRKEQ